MYLSQLFLPLFVTSVIATTYQNVTTDLQRLNNDTITLTATIKAYVGSGVTYLKWRNAMKTTISDLNRATSNVQSISPPLTVAQYTNAYGFINGTLYNVTKGYLNALVSKKGVIFSNGIAPEFCEYTRDYLAAFQPYFDAFAPKAPNQDLSTKAKALKPAYVLQFNNATQNLGC